MNKLMLTCALLCSLTIARASDPQYKTGDGLLQVDSANTTLHDAKRNKDLPVIAYFPKVVASYPVIVFSHGALGSGKSYASLLSFWAAPGLSRLSGTSHPSRR